MKDSTRLWINIIGIALNFSGILLAALVRNWGFLIFHVIILYIAQSAIRDITEKLDKLQEIENEQGN